MANFTKWPIRDGREALRILVCLSLGLFLGRQVCGFDILQNLKSEDPQSWFQSGQIALQKGDLDAAENAFRKVLSLDPQAGAAYANLGVIAMRRKNWDEALSALKKAEALLPHTPGIKLNIGLVEFQRGNYKSAIPPFESVVKDEPNATQPRYLLGLCHVFLEDYAAAARTLEPMWNAMAGDLMYLYVLDIAANKSGEKALDEKAMKQFMKIGGNSPEFHLILAKAHLQHHEPNLALQELQRVEAVDSISTISTLQSGFGVFGSG